MILNKLSLKVMEEFLGDYSKEATGSSIAKKKKLNQKSAANTLLHLENHGILRSRIEGRNKLYSLNLDDAQIIIDFICAAEHLRKISFMNGKILIKGICDRLIPHCKGIVVIFGSYAKNKEKKNSDLDVFVIGECDEKKIAEIEEIYHLDISVKCYPRKIFQKALQNHDILLEEVIKDHIILQGSEEFVSSILRKRYGQDNMVP